MEQFDGICVNECERCPELVDSRSRIVNGVGPIDADLLFVGEGPGKNEDEQGEPFVGRSGSVLDEALGEAGVLREEVRITNCRGYLDDEIETVDPTLVVTLGKVPSEHPLGRSVAITKEAGDVVETRFGDRSQRLLLSVHPAATL